MNTNGHELFLPKSLRSANRSWTSPIQIWGAHAPRVLSLAPRQWLNKETFRRGAEMGTRGRVRSPEKTPRAIMRAQKASRSSARFSSFSLV